MAVYTEGKTILFDFKTHPDIEFGPTGFGRDNYYVSQVGNFMIDDSDVPYLVKIDRNMVVDDKSGEPIEFGGENPYILDDPKGIRLSVLNFVWNREYGKYVLTIATQ